jgi:putative MATE family efflux protein
VGDGTLTVYSRRCSRVARAQKSCSLMPKSRHSFDPRLLEGSIVTSLFLLAFPIMGANLLQIAYQLIDAFWVGRLGAAAIAAVSISMPIMFLMISAGLGFAVAGTTLIAQYAGAGDRAMVDHVAAQTLLTIVALSVVLGGAGFAASPYLLGLMGTAPEVQDNAVAFLRVSFVSLPFAFVYFMFQSLMRGVGQVMLPLYTVAATVAINFVLDPVLIFGWFGVPALGVMGAAISTLIAQAIAALAGLLLLMSGRYGIALNWQSFRPDFAFVHRAFSLGYPASIEQSARGLGMTVMTFLITSFGTITTASYGVGTNVLNFVVVPAMGFSMATSTLVGQNIGANNIARAERVARLAALITFTALSGVGLLCFLFASHIVTLFVPEDADVIREGAVFIRTVAWLRVHRTSVRAHGRVARQRQHLRSHAHQPRVAMGAAISAGLYPVGTHGVALSWAVVGIPGIERRDRADRRGLVRPGRLEETSSRRRRRDRSAKARGGRQRAHLAEIVGQIGDRGASAAPTGL